MLGMDLALVLGRKLIVILTATLLLFARIL